MKNIMKKKRNRSRLLDTRYSANFKSRFTKIACHTNTTPIAYILAYVWVLIDNKNKNPFVDI